MVEPTEDHDKRSVADCNRFSIKNGVVTTWENGVLVAADTHLAPYAWKSHPEVAGDAYHAFTQIVDICLLRRPSELWLAGDVLDRVDVDPQTVRILNDQLDRMEGAKIPVKFIVGQHERHRLAQWLNVHSWPEYVHTGSWDSPIGRCHALDWQPRDLTQQSFTQIPAGTDVLLTHHVWLELHGAMMHPECSIADVPHAQIIISGDYHQTAYRTGENKTGQRATLYSPGSTVMQSLTESPKKCVSLFRAHGDTVKLDSQVLQTRGRIDYSLTASADIEWLRADLPQLIAANEATWAVLPDALRRPIIVVQYPASWPRAYQHVAEIVSPYGHLFARPQVTEQEIVDISNKRVMELDGSLATGIDLVAKPTEPHYRDLLNMLSCPRDPAALDELLDNMLERIARTTGGKGRRERI